MRQRDYREIAGGGGLVVIGSYAAIYAYSSLGMGTLSRMGPGMFPTAMGVMLAVIGCVLLVPALFREGEMPKVEFRPLFAITGSILVFALMARPFGMLPSVMVATGIASLAETEFKPLRTLVLAIALSVVSYLVFGVGLRAQLPILSLPW